MNSICVTCGTQFAEAEGFPAHCPICEDERQYVGFEGQQWITLEELRRRHTTTITEEEPNLTSFTVQPQFGIGQRAFLIRSGGRNVLWDSISLLDDAAIAYIKQTGGLHAIAISHPHYYTCIVEWSRIFGNVPVYLHEADRAWLMRSDDCIHFWDGELRDVGGELKIVRCGGHFEGASVLHWPDGADASGVLLTGDTIQVCPDRKSVSVMYSYPNYIPLPARKVRQIIDAVQPFAFDRLYGAFPHRTINNNAKAAVQYSAERYLRSIGA